MNLRAEGDQLIAALRDGDAEAAEQSILRIMAADPAAADRITRAAVASGLRNMTGIED